MYNMTVKWFSREEQQMILVTLATLKHMPYPEGAKHHAVL